MAEGRRCERNRDTALRSYYKRKAEEQRLIGQVRQLGALQRHSWLGPWECSTWCLSEGQTLHCGCIGICRLRSSAVKARCCPGASAQGCAVPVCLGCAYSG